MESERRFGALRFLPLTTLSVLLLAAAAMPAGESNPTAEAQRELFAGRYEHAIELYSRIIESQPTEPEAYYGIVRAQLQLRHSREAYAAASKALRNAPNTPGALTAAGMAAYRHGDLGKAEEHFRAALKINPEHPGALRGLASIYSSVSAFKAARDLRLKAYRAAPEDPELMLVHANTLKDGDHIAALERALASVDPESEMAGILRSHLAMDQTLGDRKLRRLTSPYQSGTIKLALIVSGPHHAYGVGLKIQFNQTRTVRLMLDTGASGISISPKLAEKAGLQTIGSSSYEVRGLGDEKAQQSFSYLASEVRIGDVTFADYPISVFRAAQSSDFDGLIGADVFQRFVVGIDFRELTLSLDPLPGAQAEPSEELVDRSAPAPGFYRIFRFGNHLAVPTSINGGKPVLFLIDSGASTNLIDAETAREYTGVHGDSNTILKGIQGKVKGASRAADISLLFAGFRQSNPDLIALDLDKMMGDVMGVGLGGILGMPVLGQLKVMINYRDGTVRFDYKKY